jgi:hypothetical protein
MVRDLAVVTQPVQKILKTTRLKAVLLHNITDLSGSYHTVFRLVYQSKRLVNREALVTEEHLLCRLDVVLSAQNMLQEAEEHVVLDTFFFLFGCPLSFSSFNLLLLLLESCLVLDLALLAFFFSRGQLFFDFSLASLTGSLILSLSLQTSLFSKCALLLNLALVSFDRGFPISLSLNGRFLCSLSLLFDQLLNFFPIRCGCFLG